MLEVKEAIKVKGYTLVTPEKIDRALNGTQNDKGQYVGGVLNADGSFDDDRLLAEYDRIGGLIRNKDGDKVATGSFYDFVNRRPSAEPKVMLEFRFGYDVALVPEGKELPAEVKAKRMVEADKVAKKKTAKKAAKKSK